MKNIDISIDEQGVAVLFLNRPDLLNALNTELMGEGLLALEELAADERVTSLIITGRGRGFCAGADLGSVGDLASPGASVGETVATSMRSYFNPLMEMLYRFPRPTLCAVNGIAAGGGAALALCADIVIVARDAKLKFVQVPQLGIVADLGANWLLPRLAGRGRAMAACLLGEPIDATRLLDWGLAWKVVEQDQLLPTAVALAATLGQLPAQTVLATRELVDSASQVSYPELLEQERLAQRELCDLPIFSQSVERFLSK